MRCVHARQKAPNDVALRRKEAFCRGPGTPPPTCRTRRRPRKTLTMPIAVSKGRVATAAAVSGHRRLFHKISDLADNEIAEHHDTVGVPHFLGIDKIDVDVGTLEFRQNWNQVGGFLIQIVR